MVDAATAAAAAAATASGAATPLPRGRQDHDLASLGRRRLLPRSQLSPSQRLGRRRPLVPWRRRRNSDAKKRSRIGSTHRFLVAAVAPMLLAMAASAASSFPRGGGAAFAAPRGLRRSKSRTLWSSSLSSSSASANANAKDLLYQVQEQILVDQGVHEDSIMREHVFPLLETTTTTATEPTTTKTKGSSRRAGVSGGGGGGFGSATPAGGSERRRPPQRRRHKAPPPVDVEPYLGAIRTDGVVRINSVLPVEVARDMREWVVRHRAESLRLVQEGQVRVQDRFSNVLLKHNRCDMTLPLGSEDATVVMDALYHVLCQSSVLPGVLRSAFGGDDPVLHELSTLISDPGSQRQVVHPDTPIAHRGDQGDDEHAPHDGSATALSSSASRSSPVLLTCFVALQDVTPDMGPTVYLPGTHTPDAHRQFFSGEPAVKDHLLQSSPKWLGLLRQGDCSLYDSRVLHCGSANRHPSESRALFYMSFRNPRVDDPGNPPSIRRDVAARKLTLSQLQGLLVEHWTTPTTASRKS